MQRVSLLLALALAISCSDGEPRANKPLSEPGEKLYALKGRVVSRDAGDNTVRVDHEAIPGFMEAMTMDYSVRGGVVRDLPPDGSSVEARLHVTHNGYWLTNVKKNPR